MPIAEGTAILLTAAVTAIGEAINSAVKRHNRGRIAFVQKQAALMNKELGELQSAGNLYPETIRKFMDKWSAKLPEFEAAVSKAEGVHLFNIDAAKDAKEDVQKLRNEYNDNASAAFKYANNEKKFALNRIKRRGLEDHSKEFKNSNSTQSSLFSKTSITGKETHE